MVLLIHGLIRINCAHVFTYRVAVDEKYLEETCFRFGNPSISWESLLMPAAEFCFKGIEVNFHAYQ